MSWKTRLIAPLLASAGEAKLQFFPEHHKLPILAYHRIIDDSRFLFDRGVISASPEIFDEQINFLKKHFSFLSFSSLKSYLKSDRKLSKPPLIITFDDGYIDNYRHAYPILKKHGACATIFLAVNYIGTEKAFWWDELAFMIRQGRQNQLRFRVNAIEHRIDLADKEIAVEKTLKVLKNIDDQKRIESLNIIKQTLQADINNTPFERQILNWDEVREMAKENIEFGSHTMTHPILANVNDKDKLRYELKKSKEKIEKETGKNVCVFSYPVGRKESINHEVVMEVKNCGYEFAATYQHGVNDLTKETDWHYLKRFDIDHYPLTKFKAKIAFPEIFKN